MCEDSRNWEKEHFQISPKSLKEINENETYLPGENDPFLRKSYSSEETQANFLHREATCCLNKLVSHQDLQSARNIIERNRDKGKMREDLTNGVTKLSSGNLFLTGICKVGEEVVKQIKNNIAKVMQAE